MFSKKKNTSKMDAEQRELYENARKRTLQKKRLFQHFIVFLGASILAIILNGLIGFKDTYKPLGYDWFVWIVLIWGFIFLIHFFNVLLVNTFMGKEWQAKQIEKLVAKQKEKIAKLQQQVEKDHPLPEKESQKNFPESKDSNDKFKPISPDKPDQNYNH
ncbi:2TM domain-containing protein [Zunongwangia profunda]|uniref:2TM domain-containing protein n=1 Tax=Zunongwangia profunda TaxID=398743 RepID=UPI002357F190|nr:2TM domain-containing protein [Zunongwangia profunda]|tara:strand:+ start:2588 stop:3064 length:477 start_codon:yes stop_codon:yes gene_type:complete